MTDVPRDIPVTEGQRLSCMEVWGGNQATFSTFEKAGIDIWLYCRPCEKHVVGGDLYYLSSCASGRITRMLLADVAGHGESAAHIAQELRELMHRHINNIRPNKLFEEVNVDFAKLSSGERFATSIVSSYFIPTSKLSLCSAGHPPPLIRRESAGRWEPVELKAQRDDIPLGIADSVRYSQLDLTVKPGDLVLCYTDGVIESRDASGAQLGVEGLLNFLNASNAEEPSLTIPRLLKNITQSTSADTGEDDITLLLFRITNRAIPLRDNLAAPYRWLKALLSKG